MDFARFHPGGSLGRRLLMTVGNVMRKSDLPVVAADCSATEMIQDEPWWSGSYHHYGWRED